MKRLIAWMKWLNPGLHVKRWMLLGFVGVVIAIIGIALISRARTLEPLAPAGRALNVLSTAATSLVGASGAMLVGMLFCVVGLTVMAFATARFLQSLSTAIVPGAANPSLVDAVYRSRYLSQGPRIVVIGGGTGLSTLLRGLKQYTSNIVAVVTVTDDGGSSGRLGRQLNILPPGDIRNCLVALADAEGTMTSLLQHRFRGDRVGEGLRDHAFGNILIAALTEISDGDFEQAVRQASRVLNVRGRVLPATLRRVTLRGHMDDGSTLEGETTIVHAPQRIRSVSLSPSDAQPLDEVLEAIRLAEIIVVGPGSVFTSVIPNLLVHGIADALHASRARKVYICNVMTQPGETDGFAASDHLKAIDAHVKRPVVNYALVNTGIPSIELLGKYRQSGATLVAADTDRIRALGYRPLPGNFISQTDVVRHDPGLLAEAVMRLIL